MKAILLAGGKGTRLRPLTLHTPKPIVPIFQRPFLHYQIDLLKQVPDIDEVILSLNYQPRRIEEVFGDGSDAGIKIRYVVEPSPLGTGGAIRYAGESLTDSVVVFNGDVLTQIDLAAVLRLHRERRAKATIVLTPVDNPSAYGLVETDADGNVRRFLEKPKADEITCDTINAGIYVLEPDTFDRIPRDTAWSIERSYFPSLVDRGETFVAFTYRAATRSTPASTCSNPRRSIASRRTRRGRSSAATSRRSWSAARRSWRSPIAATGSTSARRRSTSRCIATSWTDDTWPRRSPPAPARSRARLTSGSRTARRLKVPRFSTRASWSRQVRGLARTRCLAGSATSKKKPPCAAPLSGPGRRCHVEEEATVRGSIVWANGRIGREALVEDAILGRHCHVGRAATVGAGAVLGDKSVVTDCSRTRG